MQTGVLGGSSGGSVEGVGCLASIAGGGDGEPVRSIT